MSRLVRSSAVVPARSMTGPRQRGVGPTLNLRALTSQPGRARPPCRQTSTLPVRRSAAGNSRRDPSGVRVCSLGRTFFSDLHSYGGEADPRSAGPENQKQQVRRQIAEDLRGPAGAREMSTLANPPMPRDRRPVVSLQSISRATSQVLARRQMRPGQDPIEPPFTSQPCRDHAEEANLPLSLLPRTPWT